MQAQAVVGMMTRLIGREERRDRDMGFVRRFLDDFSGRSKRRLPDEMALLGAPAQLVDEVRRMPHMKQAEAFQRFVEGKHACMLDWKAGRDDVYEELQPLLTPEERRLLPAPGDVPADAAATIVALRRALSRAGRTLVRTESYGDFSFLVLVPNEKAHAFIAAVGPWLIDDENTGR